MRADVVVVTYRAVDILRPCLAALLKELPADWTVTVADNASGDGTAELVAAEFPVVRLLRLEENRGFGAGNNAAARGGAGEAVVLVNSDAYVEPGCLAALVAPLEADPRVGMVAGLTVMPDDPEVVDSFGVELDPALGAYNRLRHRPVAAAGTPGAAGVLAGPSGALAAYRRTAWEAAGGFDETLFAYSEDVDLALRLRAAGWRAAEAAGARAVHIGGASIGVDSPRQRAWAGFGRGFLLRRYGVLRGRTAVRALLFEALVVAFGLVRHRTLVPLRSRVAGWRAAGARRVPADRAALDPSIRPREALRRLARGR